MARAVIDVKLRVLHQGERALGPGKADLLERIAETGSISAAAKAMDMSYSRAWQLVDVMNRAFKQPLVNTEAGGRRGGGAKLTPLGADMLANYRRLEAAVAETVRSYDGAIRKHLK